MSVILYVDASMGMSANKLFGALIGCMKNPGPFIGRFNDIGFKGIRLETVDTAEKGIRGNMIEYRRTDVKNYADEMDDDGKKNDKKHKSHRHMMRGLSDIEEIIDDLAVSGRIRKRAAAVYETIAEAAAKVNGTDVHEVIMHRTGSRDVIASVVGVFMALEELGCERVCCSKVAVGSGKAMTSRGEKEIPIPIVAELLEGVPIVNGTERFEMCTADGAAIIKTIADEFGEKPYIIEKGHGAGFGLREYKHGINCVRAVVGEMADQADMSENEETEIEAVIYDGGDAVDRALADLAAAGVKDAYTVPLMSVVNGKGVLLRVICGMKTVSDAVSLIKENTSAKRIIRRAVMNADS